MAESYSVYNPLENSDFYPSSSPRRVETRVPKRSRGKLRKAPRDKERYTFFKTDSKNTTHSRYTDLRIPNGTKVRLLHNGKLKQPERDQIRRNVIRARDNVNSAVYALSGPVHRLDKNALSLVERHFGIGSGQVTQLDVNSIRERLTQIADGLNSPRFEIKIKDRIMIGDEKYIKGWVPAPHRILDGAAREGLYTSNNFDTNIQLSRQAALNNFRGADVIVDAVGVNAGQLNGQIDGRRRGSPSPRNGPQYNEVINRADVHANFSSDIGDLSRAPVALPTEPDREGTQERRAMPGVNSSLYPQSLWNNRASLGEETLAPPAYSTSVVSNDEQMWDKLKSSDDSERAWEQIKLLSRQAHNFTDEELQTFKEAIMERPEKYELAERRSTLDPRNDNIVRSQVRS